MAAPIKSMFGEVQYELVKIILLNVFLSTVILFLVADLVALIFGMPLWYVILAAFLYFLVMLVIEVRRVSVRNVEDRNPELREILRTAKDNVNEDSLMAHALFYEVLEKMRRVSSGTFLDFRKLMTKIGVIFALAVVLVSIAFFNINIQQFSNPFEKPFGWLGNFLGRGDEADGQALEDDVFGAPSMARLGERQLTATINPSLSSPDFSKVDPANPSADPLADLSSGDAAFQSCESCELKQGLTQRDQERSYNYAKSTQGES